MKTVAIIGGGFSGTTAAVNVVRNSTESLRIVIINNGWPVGRGVAYGTKHPEHLLNVAARNMSALADDLTHFVEWLSTRCDFAEVPEARLRETFVPRRIYGDYLRGLLHAHSRMWGSTIEIIPREAVSLSYTDAGARIQFDNGDHIDADKVLLATGNPPPAPLGHDFAHPNYCSNGWQLPDYLLSDRTKSVVLLGTGLTMVDVLLTMLAHDWEGPILAVSRSGAIPQSHFQGIEYSDFPPPHPELLGLSTLAKAIAEHCQRLKDRDANPALLVDKLRPYTQLIWRNLTLAERRTFLKKYRSLWNVTRHRIAPTVHQIVTEAIARGRLRIEMGTVRNLTCDGNRILVGLEDRSGTQRSLSADLAINCTGPQERFTASLSPLWQHLIASGTVDVDELDMGIRVTAEFATIDRNGQPSNSLYAIGPALKGTLWETTAVPELRVQALAVARTITGATANLNGAPIAWPSQPGVELLEYCI